MSDALDRFLLVATQLSNIAYNVKQRDDVPADIRNSCKNTQADYDFFFGAAKREIDRLRAENSRLKQRVEFDQSEKVLMYGRFDRIFTALDAPEDACDIGELTSAICEWAKTGKRPTWITMKAELPKAKRTGKAKL